MVKPDVKHNYYADLELPNTCTVEDVKKQYRKLALLYHPDRNAGREEEFVPKFQSIQTAHEVLGDATLKNKYDADRRKAGLYPTFRPGQQTQAPGNPYAATSPYPPPPRRTQPGAWQRPQAAGATPTGADRFTNFTRGAPTARKDAGPAADRTNNFRAWQNLNNAQERQQQQQHFTPPGGPPPVPQPSPNRPRPPPRADTKMPSEEEIRAGMNYRKAARGQQAYEDPRAAEARQSAWAHFQQQNAGKPGVSRSSTTRTPRKAGFDPNLPGSDERPAADKGYAHRHRSEDFGKASPGVFPPPPPGPPPMSPTSPTARPFADPLRPFKSRGEEQTPQVPYAEGTRKRTPYTSFIGEKTQFNRESPEGLRRSASTRDATKLSPNGGSSERARSTSPLGRQKHPKDHQQNGGSRKPFVDYSDSDASNASDASGSDVDDIDSTAATPGDTPRPGTAPHTTGPFERPKAVPTPPSRRYNGSTNPFSPPSATPDGAQSDSERPGMEQRTPNNMYATPDFFQHSVPTSTRFQAERWASGMFGRHSTSRAGLRGSRVPRWAVPSSVQPGLRGKTSREVIADASNDVKRSRSKKAGNDNDSNIDCAALTKQQRSALAFVRRELERSYGEVPDGLDMDVFLKLASTASEGNSTGNSLLDRAMARALDLYPSVASSLLSSAPHRNTRANSFTRNDSFTFPFKQDMFTPNKSRSHESINTKFSPEGWTGQFTGATDYFAAPPSGGKKPPSPSRRQKSGLRSATVQVPPTAGSSAQTDGVPPLQAFSPGGSQQDPQSAPGGVTFSKEEWEKTFKDPSWSWPAPPPNPPTPNVGAKVSARKASKSSARSAASSTGQYVDRDGAIHIDGADSRSEHDAPLAEDADAMDIDSTPPAQHAEHANEGTSTQANGGKEPRLYSVPPSDWRREQQANGHHAKPSNRASSGPGLKTNLEELAHVEPLARDSNGLKSMHDMSSTLPFQSQSAATPPTQTLEPRKLQLPALPKAPEPPTKLTKASWHAYANAFGAYLQAFHAFNTTMLQHFAAREGKAHAQIAGGCAWLVAVGDTVGTEPQGASGFGSYLREVREDEAVRETWGLGCERHGEASKGFERVRERVRKVVEMGGLVEQ